MHHFPQIITKNYQLPLKTKNTTLNYTNTTLKYTKIYHKKHTIKNIEWFTHCKFIKLHDEIYKKSKIKKPKKTVSKRQIAKLERVPTVDNLRTRPRPNQRRRAVPYL